MPGIKPKVFLLEEPKHGLDTTSASSFGEIITLFRAEDRRPSVFKATEFGGTVICKLEELGFDSNTDFFILTGSLVCVSIALGCMMSIWPTLNLLLYSSIEGRYVSKKIDAILIAENKNQMNQPSK